MRASKHTRGINFKMYGYHKDRVQITNHKAVRQAYTIQKSEHSFHFSPVEVHNGYLTFLLQGITSPEPTWLMAMWSSTHGLLETLISLDTKLTPNCNTEEVLDTGLLLEPQLHLFQNFGSIDGFFVLDFIFLFYFFFW